MKSICFRTVIGIALLCLLAGCGKQPAEQNATSNDGTSNRSTSSGSESAPTADETAFLPNSSMTPGDTFDVTKDDVCRPGYSSAVRNVPTDVKKQVYEEYDIAQHKPGEYEVDHLISLELGGSNSIKNLWPQSYRTQPWNAHVKDKLENRLHEMVCSGEIDLATAQQEIASNWIAAYKKYFHTGAPLTADERRQRLERSHGENDAAQQEAPASASGSSSEQVWVNTRSGAYWRPGTRYYGKTKQGEYMSESEAIRQGYHAAGE